MLAAWVEQPVSGRRLKDEFFMKFVGRVDGWRSRSAFEGQRREYLRRYGARPERAPRAEREGLRLSS